MGARLGEELAGPQRAGRAGRGQSSGRARPSGLTPPRRRAAARVSDLVLDAQPGGHAHCRGQERGVCSRARRDGREYDYQLCGIQARCICEGLWCEAETAEAVFGGELVLTGIEASDFHPPRGRIIAVHPDRSQGLLRNAALCSDVWRDFRASQSLSRAESWAHEVPGTGSTR